MSITALIQELELEGARTRRVLERVPSDKLAWVPHAKSMHMGRLAMHIATIPGRLSAWVLTDEFQFAPNPTPEPASTAEILAAHDASIATAKQNLSSLSDAALDTMWTGKRDGKTIMSMPKGALIRSLVLNHWFHHRGQLSVYLRLLDVPVPSIYGPSADENPFA
jgi:uncharacterized damage-inducible protein DinB